MKLLPLAIATAALLTMGCSKKPTPAFEASVREWQSSQCSCYMGAEDYQRCSKPAPDTDLSTVEQLMVNAGVLTDKRRDTVRDAERQVSACAQGAVTRSIERQRAKELRALQDNINLKNLKVPGTATAPAKKRSSL